MKFYIETYGCTTNKFDSEALAGQLAGAGHELAENEEEADLVIVNTCTVINTTSQKILHRISEIKKPLLVAGCMAQVQGRRVLKANPSAGLLGTFAVSKVCGAVERVMRGEHVMVTGRVDGDATALPCHHFDGEIVPVVIARGCLGECAYCITRLARGTLESFGIDGITEAVRKAAEAGAKEIRLTSQDNGVYGVDRGTDLAELLNAVTKVPGDFKVRVGMMNPAGVLKILPMLVEAFVPKKIRRFAHIPVQSGSDKVLGEMKRDYRVADFEKVVGEFRKALPGISISTDIIVGYPTETYEDFLESVELVKRVRPEVLNITRYSPRPGTESAGLKNLDSKLVKERSRVLTKVHRSFVQKNYEGKSSVDGE